MNKEFSYGIDIIGAAIYGASVSKYVLTDQIIRNIVSNTWHENIIFVLTIVAGSMFAPAMLVVVCRSSLTWVESGKSIKQIILLILFPAVLLLTSINKLSQVPIADGALWILSGILFLWTFLYLILLGFSEKETYNNHKTTNTEAPCDPTYYYKWKAAQSNYQYLYKKLYHLGLRSYMARKILGMR